MTNSVTYRIKTIASLVDNDSIILDVGTDHGYLPIYLTREGIVKKAYASDVSVNALNFAKNNIKESGFEIKTFLSNGLESIEVIYDTLIITGMGFHTIKKILCSGPLPDTIITQSNSEHYFLRKYMNSIGYKIEKEVVILDKKIYYVIIKYVRGFEKMKKRFLYFGKSKNVEYFNYLLEKNIHIMKKVPFKRKLILYRQKVWLKKLLKENGGI